MGNKSEAAYKLKADVIYKFLRENRKEPAWLARKTGTHPKSLMAWLRGRPALCRNIAALASVMRVDMQSICIETLPERVLSLDKGYSDAAKTDNWEIKLPAESMKTWTQEKREALSEAIRLVISVGGKIQVMGESEGCLKVTLKLTPEQAEALVRAYEEGKLAPLGISELRPVAAVIPLWRRPTLRLGLGAVSVACGLSGFFPIEAMPVYILGLAMALAGAALGYYSKGRRSLLLPGAALILNTVAIVIWPTVCGLFPTPGGYELRVGERERIGELEITLGDSFPEGIDYQILVTTGGNPPAPTDDHASLHTGGKRVVSVRLPSKRYGIFIWQEGLALNIRGEKNIDPKPVYIWPEMYGKTTVRLESDTAEVTADWIKKQKKR